ncbi:hypothetical protein ACS5PK_16290 [Roseateles sp. DB2]|uniref:hypothetical protein n=1 Tax=Roseateles sp. DB2 TaxID=3453717 RepID=UPI003EEFF95D
MNDTETRGGRRLRHWVALSLALCVAVGAWWNWQGDDEDHPNTEPPAAGPAATSTAGPAARTASAGLAARAAEPAASPQAAASRPSVAASAEPAPYADALSPEQLAQIEKQWCIHGMKAHQQAQQALERAYPVRAGEGKLDMTALEARSQALFKETGTKAMLAVQLRLKRRWIEQLRQRGDMRSQAAADYLTASTTFGEEAETSLQHLLGLAQSSRDPLVFMIWQLAKIACTRQTYCNALPLSDWRSLDARNLLAWLPDPANRPEAVDLDWNALANTSFASSYLEDFQGLLLPLLDAEPPGLALQQGLALVSRLRYEWPVRSGAVALASTCVEVADTAPARMAVCLHAADLLWRSPSSGLFEHKFALGMASMAGALEQSPWAERMAFVKRLSPSDGQRLMDLEYQASRDKQSCDTLAYERQQLKEQARRGLWAAALGGAGTTPLP